MHAFKCDLCGGDAYTMHASNQLQCAVCKCVCVSFDATVADVLLHR
jgi:hypothetical protein